MNGTPSLTSVIPLGYGPGGPLPTPTPWIQYGTAVQWSGGVVVGNPPGGDMGPGAVNADAYFVNGAPFDLGNYLPLTGGTIAGPLTIQGAALFQGTVDGLTFDEGTF